MNKMSNNGKIYTQPYKAPELFEPRPNGSSGRAFKLLKYLLPLTFYLSCNQQPNNSTSSSSDSGRTIARTDTVYLTRNIIITPANAYSDLFLDSADVEKFIESRRMKDDEAKTLRSFYNYRNMEYAWFTSQGFTEQAKGFWNLQDQLEFKTDKSLRSRMDTLLQNDSLVVSRFDTAIANDELLLTATFLQFYKNNRDKILFAAISPERVVPVMKTDALALADSILALPVDSVSNSYPYLALRKELRLYSTIARQGGWRTIVFNSKPVKKGATSPVITLIKRRLQLTGDLNGADTTNVYNDSLFNAIKNYQQRNGMKPTGIIADTLVRSFNVPVGKRIEQIIVNLNRLQWMPVNQDANYISVNIPDFMLYAYENNAKVFDMPVVVGKEGTHTMMFTGKMDQVVFSPYWNIPASIVKNEILPKMRSDPGYLQQQHMEIVGKNDSVPRIRQLPGKDNALGRVKFLFPNRYDIYLHDTYAKEVFKKNVRTVSHGCIRVADAEKLAGYVLKNNPAWTPEKILAAMNSGKEQFVKVNPPIRVLITYLTAWVDENGKLNFRNDVYGNDRAVGQMLF